jgi:hypothetical protein
LAGVWAYNTAASVTNASGGMIAATGAAGIAVTFQAGGTIDNSGLITGQHYGVKAFGTTTIINSGVIDPASGLGVYLAGGTILDAGTIAGGGTAIEFGDGGGSNLLLLEPGYSLSGRVTGGLGSNTLELGGSLGSPLTVTYASEEFTDFQDLLFGSGGHDTLKIGATSGTLPAVISGFTLVGDRIDLTAIAGGTLANVGTVNANDQLVLANGSETVTLQLDKSGNYSGIVYQAAPDGSGGAAKPIKWIGRRSYRGAFLLRNSDLWPILVKPGALGPGAPARGLYISGHHALFIDGLLIPVECLVNGSSIRRCDCPDEIEYFHIDLESHDVIFAEGTPAETFVDCDGRGIFHSAHEFALLYPGEERPRWTFCAPRVEAGRKLDAVRRRLLAHANQLFPAAGRAA